MIVVGILLELIDLSGDFTYLFTFPHLNAGIVFVLAFTLFFPFSVELSKQFEKKLDVITAVKKATISYFGFEAFAATGTEQSNPLERVKTVTTIALFENMVQFLILNYESFKMGSRWSAF